VNLGKFLQELRVKRAWENEVSIFGSLLALRTTRTSDGPKVNMIGPPTRPPFDGSNIFDSIKQNIFIFFSCESYPNSVIGGRPANV
jgi:hypothetical protein